MIKRIPRWRWYLVVAIVAIVSIAAVTTLASPSVAAKSSKRVTVWIQVTDSCKQALSGATFRVTGSNVNMTTQPTTGSTPKGLPGYVNGHCPIQSGTCVNFSTGCTSVVLNVPASGTAVYKITVAKTAPGHGSNLSYAICNGGSACVHGPEVAIVKVKSAGAVSATVLNHYPNGETVTWPLGRSSYKGSQSDPIMFHEFGIGNGSIQCDGDHDADDYLTGTPTRYCDSDND